MNVGASAKAGWSALKAHWGFFLVAGFLLLVGVLWYDHKHQGSLTTRVAGIPIVGKLFAA